jgi:hypothetical protein
MLTASSRRVKQPGQSAYGALEIADYVTRRIPVRVRLSRL